MKWLKRTSKEREKTHAFIDNLNSTIREYGRVLEEHAEDIVIDINLLPEPKNAMRLKLLGAAKMNPPGEHRDWLKRGYLFLAHFQSMTSAERDAISRWRGSFGISNLEERPKSIQQAVIAEIAEVGGTATELYDRVAEEVTSLSADLNAAGL